MIVSDQKRKNMYSIGVYLDIRRANRDGLYPLKVEMESPRMEKVRFCMEQLYRTGEEKARV